MKKMILGITGSLVLALGAPADVLASHASGRDMAFQVRVGGFFPEGGGEFWDGVEQTFTLEAGDFNDAILGFSLVGSIGNNLEAAFNADFYEKTVGSAVEGFVDQDGFPILHDTRLQFVPLTVDLRVLPGGRYRYRGPQGLRVRKPVFYVGGGAGLTYWEYEEIGDFVDFSDNSIFFDRFSDTGVAFEVHGLAGLELPIGRTWNLLFEGRYSWVDDEPGGDFSGLGELELGGAAAYVGASFRF